MALPTTGERPRRWWLALAAAALVPGAAQAQFIPAAQCQPRPCACADMPILEHALKASNGSLTAWENVLGQLTLPNPPQTLADTRARFDAVNPADGTLLTEMQKVCPSFNGGTVGAVDKNGQTQYLACFCQAFCDSIVEATGVHERRHHDNMVDLALKQMVVVLGGLAVGESVPYNPSVLTLSELDAHQAGSDYLQQKLSAFVAQNATCTWKPIVPVVSPAPPAPSGLRERLRLLYRRVVGAQ